jgi:hypothetical protein
VIPTIALIVISARIVNLYVEPRRAIMLQVPVARAVWASANRNALNWLPNHLRRCYGAGCLLG